LKTSRARFYQGAREAAGVPVATLAAGYVGFGALAAGNGLPATGAILSTVLLWAMPAQLILVEMQAADAALVAVLLSVTLSSARFLPMTVSLMPMLYHERHRGWHYYLAAHLLSITGWTMAMVRFPVMPVAARLPWLFGFTLVCITGATAATAIGYLVADALTPLAKLGLVFLAPVYYLLVMLAGMRDRLAALAIAGGALCGPLAWIASPDWSVLSAGIAGGTLAYAVDRRLRRG
jgi:predicted branched-subunit amino acid permease